MYIGHVYRRLVLYAEVGFNAIMYYVHYREPVARSPMLHSLSSTRTSQKPPGYTTYLFDTVRLALISRPTGKSPESFRCYWNCSKTLVLKGKKVALIIFEVQTRSRWPALSLLSQLLSQLREEGLDAGRCCNCEI